MLCPSWCSSSTCLWAIPNGMRKASFCSATAPSILLTAVAKVSLVLLSGVQGWAPLRENSSSWCTFIPPTSSNMRPVSRLSALSLLTLSTPNRSCDSSNSLRLSMEVKSNIWDRRNFISLFTYSSGNSYSPAQALADSTP